MMEDDYATIAVDMRETCDACGGRFYPQLGSDPNPPYGMGIRALNRLKVTAWSRGRPAHSVLAGIPMRMVTIGGELRACGVHPTVCSRECIARLGPEWLPETEN